VTQPSTPLIIFGAGQIAELAWFYFTHDSAYTPVAFTLDRAFMTDDHFHGLPVIPFDELAQHFRPDQVEVFVALSYAKVNALRAQKVAEVRNAGYRVTLAAGPRYSLVFNRVRTVSSSKTTRFSLLHISATMSPCGAATISGITRWSKTTASSVRTW
jgi:FlaA1/EpsC-like NDP-sugar epimerase